MEIVIRYAKEQTRILKAGANKQTDLCIIINRGKKKYQKNTKKLLDKIRLGCYIM